MYFGCSNRDSLVEHGGVSLSANSLGSKEDRLVACIVRVGSGKKMS